MTGPSLRHPLTDEQVAVEAAVDCAASTLLADYTPRVLANGLLAASATASAHSVRAFDYFEDTGWGQLA